VYNAFDHQELEGLIGNIVSQRLYYGPGAIVDYLPAPTQAEFEALYPWPPPPIFTPDPCHEYSLTNPTNFYRQKWHSHSLARNPGEGVAHAYARNGAQIATTYVPWLTSDCITSKSDMRRTTCTMSAF